MAALDYKTLLIALITGTDLEQYSTDTGKLEYAISYAKDEIVSRYGVADYTKVPAKYDRYVIEGAKWYLATIGVEGQSMHSENGISRTYKSTPDWLKHIPQKVGVVKNVTKAKI